MKSLTHMFFWVFLALGLVSIFLGIVTPLFIESILNDRLEDLWLDPGGFDKWGSIPGDYGIKLITSFKIYNITNLPEVQNSTRGILTELPRATFQEYSSMFNWDYLDDNLEVIGRKKAGNYLAYNYETTLIPIPSNETTVPPLAPVTSVNYITYIVFYQLSHNVPIFYMIPTFYDVVMALENDFYIMILSYVSWTVNISNTTSTTEYLNSQGFDASTILSDPIYGWSTWETLEPWIQSLIDYSKTNQSNAFENIQMRFQMDGLISLILPGSLLHDLYVKINRDMKIKYGTDDPQRLGQLQWATAIVTLDLPLGLGVLNISNTGVPVPSFLMMNKTFGTVPEEYFVQYILDYKEPLFFRNASNLMEVSYDYPRTNTKSFLYLNNLIALFNDTEQAKTIFGFDDLQINISRIYLGSLINFKVPEYNVTLDKYSLTLSKLVASSFVSNTVNLRNDAYWAVPTMIVFNNFTELGVSCEDFIGNINSSLISICSSPIGWNNLTVSWPDIQIWVKAAFKGNSSSEYSTLLQYIDQEDLDLILFHNDPNLQDLAISALQITSKAYFCKLSICNYEELFFLQWGMSWITSNLIPGLEIYVNESLTMQDWLPSRYSVPIEWSLYSDLPIFVRASKVLSYSTFLNPGIIRLFLNSYFQGNLTATAQKFNLPTVAWVEDLYTYLISIIPGFEFFTTRPYEQWIYGFQDKFASYVANLSVYNGGIPTAVTFLSPAMNQSDEGMPRHIVRTGRLNTEVTRFIYKYYDSRIVTRYMPTYNESAPGGKSMYWRHIWATDINYTGGIGGSFGTKVKKDDTLPVYIQAIMRNVNLTYDKSVEYHGLKLSYFRATDYTLKTTASYPDNWKYFQEASGFDGFMNLSAAYGCPFFIGFDRCYLCEDAAVNMFDLHEYIDVGQYGKQIFGKPSDSPYAQIEPFTGVGVRLRLNIQMRVGFYNDYFFKGFYEPVEGKGVYFPLFQMQRQIDYTDHQVNKFFGDLQRSQEIRRAVFWIGVIGGTILIAFSFVISVFMYRSKQFTTWGRKRNSLIRQYIRMEEIQENR